MILKGIRIKFYNVIRYLIVITTISGLLAVPGNTIQAKDAAQENVPLQKATELLTRLTPQEKVGQLFLVTFKGTDTSDKSQIFSLVTQHYVGGVVLERKNDNFTGNNNTVQSTYDLTSSLQKIKWQSAQPGLVSGELGELIPSYVPLLIGISQEGDGAPYSQIVTGLPQIPDEMTLGATWNPNLAEQIGAILGSELNALGVNLLMGPSLDVLELPIQEGGEDLGTRSFGGDPYWVGEMGKAFISGIHQGSDNKVAVMAKYFPGRGGADRPAEEEVATVRKSLEQLKQIELAPFFAVTGGAADPLEVTDGLLVSHIRYQGFQGNIRVTTRPVSFDPAALSQILALPQFSGWRDRGGLILSDDLGSNAVRRFNDPTLMTFDARQTARNAFLAGNDLLFADDFTATGDPDSFTSIVSTLGYFTQKYKEDPTFAKSVDAAVLRILTLKYKLYPTFTISTVTPTVSELQNIGADSQPIQDSAEAAAALINPSAAELTNVLPDPPNYRERIIFLMDSTEYQQCSTCDKLTALASDSLRNAVIRLYGAAAGGQVMQLRLIPYSFKNIGEWLTGIEPPPNFETDLRQADWVVVGLQNYDPNRPTSMAFKQLLAQRPDILRNKKVVVFAFNAPYYLDATDISKVTAYYAIYSKTQPFIDLAARILFREVSPKSAPPVSIPGVGYDLITATSPDPAQVISLVLDMPEVLATTPTPGVTPEPTAAPEFKIGDTLPIRTGVILDHNRHPVPDGTLVRFIIRAEAETSTTQQIEATTVGGIARTSYRIPANGFLDIRVISEPAVTSDILQLDVPLGAAAAITAVAPSPIPSETAVPSITPVTTATSTPEPPSGKTGQPTFWEWLLVVMIIGIGTALVYNLGRKIHSIRWGVRWAFCSLIGGLASYIYMTANFPGGHAWLNLTGTTGLMVIVILCMSLGLAAGVMWHAVSGKPGN